MNAQEFEQTARSKGAWWSYDYAAADQGKLGLHAELKSGFHSDGFFVSKIFLEDDGVLNAMALNLATKLEGLCLGDRHTGSIADYVGAIPDGATTLGDRMAEILGAKKAVMKKADGKTSLVSEIPAGAVLLFVEDVCTKATAFMEATAYMRAKHPLVRILAVDPVILNRGGLKSFAAEGLGMVTVVPVVERRIQEWPAAECPLCIQGSKSIKPKATLENWQQLITSQL